MIEALSEETERNGAALPRSWAPSPDPASAHESVVYRLAGRLSSRPLEYNLELSSNVITIEFTKIEKAGLTALVF